jgi:hypothetical protein
VDTQTGKLYSGLSDRHNEQYDEVVSSQFRDGEKLAWSKLESERAKIRAILKDILEHLPQEERKAIRKLIESLLKGAGA